METSTIDLDFITEIALRGVRRANIFSILGTNLIDRATAADVRAPGLIHRNAVPEEVAEKEFDSIRGHFRQWVVCQSLCELAETSDVFLISVHNAVVLLSRNRAVAIGSQRKLREFPRVGMKEKLERLHTLIDLDRKFIDHVVSIANARKFIAHYLGLVPPVNSVAPNGFEVSWLGHDVVAQMKSHGEVTIARDAKGPIQFPEEAMIGLKFLIRRKKFSVGEAVLLSEHDIYEICMMFADFAVHVKNQIVQFAMRHNISVHEKPKVSS